MKHLIFSAGICSLALAHPAQAQDMSLKASTTAPKLTLGLQTGLTRENQHGFGSPNYYSGGGLHVTYPSLGMFARYRLGEHLAIQAGIEGTKFNTVFYRSTYYPGNTYSSTVNTASFDIPISLQYHMLDSKSKIRPYFGVGWMTRFNFYNIKEHYQSESVNRKERHAFGHVMLSQGVTWQLNKKWQINQSVNYMFNGAANMINFRFGVGYTIK